MSFTKDQDNCQGDKLEYCSNDDTKVKNDIESESEDLQKDERNPKNEENIPVNDRQQSGKNSENRQEPLNNTHNSMTKETTEDNRKKKWLSFNRVHYDSIEDKVDTSESDDEEDTSGNTEENENYKDENPIGSNLYSITNTTELGIYRANYSITNKINVDIGYSTYVHEPILNNTHGCMMVPYVSIPQINSPFIQGQNNVMNYYPIEINMNNNPMFSPIWPYSSLSSEGQNIKLRMIFLDNLPVKITKEIIEDIFLSCGDIEQTQIYELKKYYGKKVKKGKKRKLTKVASITFSTMSSAQKAVLLNPLWINNYYVNIQYFYDDHISVETFMINRIFLLNVPHNVTKEMLCKFFEDCGLPLYIRFLHKAITEEFTGIVYVQFRTLEATNRALQKKDLYLSNAPLVIVQDLPLLENTTSSQLFYPSFQGLREVIENSKK